MNNHDDDVDDDEIMQFIPFDTKINSMERGLQPNTDLEIQPFYMNIYTSVNNYFRYFFRGFLSE